MADGIVAKGVYSKYCNGIIHFGSWVHGNEVKWFTDHVKEMYEGLILLQAGEKAFDRRKQIKAGWMAVLQDAKEYPIFHVDNITASRVMEGWLSKQANQSTLKPLSGAGYSAKWLAIFHLIHVHNGKGPMEAFRDEMMSLWKGVSRTCNKRKI